MNADERGLLKPHLAAQLDTLIAQRVTALWLKLEAQTQATMPADGVPVGSVPGGDWAATGVASIVMQERHRLEAWKETVLEDLLTSPEVLASFAGWIAEQDARS
jgi:hypothetical protein